MYVTDPADNFQIGAMHFTLIGPYLEELEELRDDWNDWLEEMKSHREKLKKKSGEDFRPLVASSVDSFVAPLSVRKRVVNIAYCDAGHGRAVPDDLSDCVLLFDAASKAYERLIQARITAASE